MKRTLCGSFGTIGVTAFLAVAVAGASTPPAKNFVANLKGSSEVPAVVTKATGQAVFTLRKVNGADVLTYKLSAANFGKSIKLTAAHIHCGAKGVAGDVAVTLYGGAPVTPKGNFTSGTITASTSFTGASCGVTSLATLLEKMRAVPSQLYVNIHSTTHPGGEIRGQVKIAGPRPS